MRNSRDSLDSFEAAISNSNVEGIIPSCNKDAILWIAAECDCGATPGAAAHTSMRTGSSISVLKAVMSSAPTAPSTAL